MIQCTMEMRKTTGVGVGKAENVGSGFYERSKMCPRIVANVDGLLLIVLM